MLGNADELAGAVRSAWVAAAVAAALTLVVAGLISGPEGAGLALGGALLGIGNLQLAVLGLKHSPVAFLGSSLPRLGLITVLLAVLVVVLGPVGVWGLVGLLVTHLAQVGAVLRLGIRLSQR